MDENERIIRDKKIGALNNYIDKLNSLMAGLEESNNTYIDMNNRKQQVQQEIDNLRALE